MDILDSFYYSRPDDFPELGELYKPPERFPFSGWSLVARLPKNPPDGDGFEVEVYESRMPAKFYRMVALPSKNSVNKERPGFIVSTGSGSEMRKLIYQFSRAVAQGMIGIDQG